MPEIPPDPRAVLDARIHHFKKQTQKLNLEFLEAEAELERAKAAVKASAAPAPVATPVVVLPEGAIVTIRPFAEGLGYSLEIGSGALWFDAEIHAINYAQEICPHCEIVVLDREGLARHHYRAAASGLTAQQQEA